jgi:hypothetical protein
MRMTAVVYACALAPTLGLGAAVAGEQAPADPHEGVKVHGQWAISFS